MRAQLLSIAAGLAAIQVNAYTDSEADCKAFASLFNGTCNSVVEPMPTGDFSKEAGKSITCSTQNQALGKDKIRCPDSASLEDSCVLTHKLCVTCGNKGGSSEVFIRFQSNGIPKHCYRTTDDAEDYPKTQVIDFTVSWNRKVVGQFNEKYNIDRKVQTTEGFDKILCDSGILQPIHMMVNQGYEEAAGSTQQYWAAGYTTQNLTIMNALTITGKDAFHRYSETKDFDSCLLHSEPVNRLTSGNAEQTKMPGLLHYRTMSPCMTIPPTSNPPLCSDVSSCKDDPYTYMYSAWSDKTNNGGVVGLARDGHVIVGPYNDDGELWNCDEHDVCNGTFLPDASYAYVLTTTFPYAVGCWGPGEVQYKVVDAKCSPKSCQASTLQVYTSIAAALVLVGSLISF